jgi:GT2 family glycosyltransferase
MDSPNSPSSPPEIPRCTVIVVSYQSVDELPSCLDAIRAQRDVEISAWVVDNASDDGSADLVRERYPDVHLVANSMNAGFGRANNQVLLTEASPFYALVNPDAVLPPDAIRACVQEMARHPDVGVISTRMVYPDGSLQRSCGSFPDIPNLIGETLRIDRIIPGMNRFTSYSLPAAAHDQVREVDWIQGSFLVLRGEVVRETGGFDPNFFMYGEEMEWCYRIRQSGSKVVYLPRPEVVHKGGASAQHVPGAMFVEHLKGRIRFFSKHRGRASVWSVRGLIAFSILLRTAARETQIAGRRLLGRGIPDELRHRQEIFRAALAWVMAGQPIAPPVDS